MLEAERAEVAAASRRLAAEGLVVGTAGNVSARAGDLVAVTPMGATLGELEAASVCVVDLEGRLVDGTLEPTSEIALHLGIYRTSDAGAVVHVHSPLATAAACVLDELPCIHYQMLELGGAVRVAPYATFGTERLAALVAAALEGRTAALLSNHGAVVHAAGAGAAVERAILLEWACGVYWHARLLGSPRLLDDAEMAAVAAAMADRGYGRPRPAVSASPAPPPVP